MNRLKVYIVIFSAALLVSVGYLVVHTYQGVAQEEAAEFHFFANTLFERISDRMIEFAATEEDRPIDDYLDGAYGLTDALAVPYVKGYYQVDPNGRITTAAALSDRLPDGLRQMAARLKGQSRVREKASLAAPPSLKKRKVQPEYPQSEQSTLSSRYFNKAEPKVARAPVAKKAAKAPASETRAVDQREAERFLESTNQVMQSMDAMEAPLLDEVAPESGDLEVGYLESTRISEREFFFFRRVIVGETFYIQGVVVDMHAMLSAMADTVFADQPMAEFAGLTLEYETRGYEPVALQSGLNVAKPKVTLGHDFPRPFDFAHATLACASIPRQSGRDTLTMAVGLLGFVIVLGLLAIYASARRLVELSQRRAGFVSSVTHELKTPLTNIRMYVEMLQQGVGATPEKRERYLDTISSESARLTRLINDVLEFSKLESGTRQMEMEEGDVNDVVRKGAGIVADQLTAAGFTLVVDTVVSAQAQFDREALVQVLLNLVENSLKFGAQSEDKRIAIRTESGDGEVRIIVTDTGPGIPDKALSRIFDDFYRVEDGLSRKTKGTGIGLAVVKKMTQAMGGSVRAENNAGAGCSIVVTLKAAGGE